MNTDPHDETPGDGASSPASPSSGDEAPLPAAPSPAAPSPAAPSPAAPALERPAAWRIYAVTASMLPLTMLLTTVVAAMTATAYALHAVAFDGAALDALGELADYWMRVLFQEPGRELPSLIVGVFANSGGFAFVALLLASKLAPGQSTAAPGTAAPGTAAPSTADRRAILRARLRLRPASLPDLLIGAVGMIALASGLDAVISIFDLDQLGRLAEMRDAISSLSIGERALAAGVIAAGAGIAEELYFRGFMFTRIELAQGRIVALLATSAIFGAFHLDLIHSPIAAMMGLYLGLCVMFTGSVWVSIAAHVINNAVATFFAGETFTDAYAYVAAPAGFIVCVLALALLARRHRGEHHAPVW